MADQNFTVLDLDDLLDADEVLSEEDMALTTEFRTVPTGTYSLYGDSYEIRQLPDDHQYNPGRIEINLVFVDDDGKKYYATVSYQKPVTANQWTGEHSDKVFQLWGQLTRAMHMPRATHAEVIRAFAEGPQLTVDIDEYVKEMRVGDVIRQQCKDYYDKQDKDDDDTVYYTLRKGDDSSRTHFASLDYRLRNKVKSIKSA